MWNFFSWFGIVRVFTYVRFAMQAERVFDYFPIAFTNYTFLESKNFLFLGLSLLYVRLIRFPPNYIAT